MINLTDSARVALLLLSTLALIRLGFARFDKWKTIYTEKEKASWTAFFLIALTDFEGAIENWLQDNKGGPRQVLGLMTIIAVLWVTYKKDDRRIVFNTREMPPDEENNQETGESP